MFITMNYNLKTPCLTVQQKKNKLSLLLRRTKLINNHRVRPSVSIYNFTIINSDCSWIPEN